MDDEQRAKPDTLFDLPAVPTGGPAPASRGRPRLQRPDRDQVRLRAASLDELLPPDHRARLVWAFTERLDLS
jgi:hypothetical protein